MERRDDRSVRRRAMSLRLGFIIVLSIIADMAICLEQSEFPVEIHKLFRQRAKFGVKDGQRVKGSWGAWTSWSECSRSCGTGVQSQSRDCVPFREYSKKRSIELSGVPESRATVRPYCIGTYKRYHVCNTQECPITGDLRAEQCAKFNGKLYKGQRYQWEPFLAASNECALNCRAVGQPFYATLQPAVLDGTPCQGPVTLMRIPGVLAPGATANRWLCVAGQCKSVGCDGIVGSQRLLDACGVCGGEGESCKLYEGIFFEPKLGKGYHPVTTIPRGAMSLNITEIRRSGTVLALKETNGSYILNGPWLRSISGYHEGAGTTFVYRKGNDLNVELILSNGPLGQPVDLMVHSDNVPPEIVYKYLLPLGDKGEERAMIAPPVLAADARDRSDNEIPVEPQLPTVDSSPKTELDTTEEPKKNSKGPPHTKMAGDQPAQMRKERKKKRKNKKFMWTIAGSTPCSKACGGGVQRATFKCFRVATQTIAPDRRCQSLERPPSPPPLRCNTRPCPARWRAGAWSECSVTCGLGVQTRELECVQELTDRLTMRVADGACIETSSLKTSSACEMPRCTVSVPESRQPLLRADNPVSVASSEASRWSTGPWGPCSATCGNAIRKRRVTCVTAGASCSLVDKPTEESTCDVPICEEVPPVGSSWLYTEWSDKCSVECGTGLKTRQVACQDGNEATCGEDKKPVKSETCTGYGTNCTDARYEWFIGPWGSCTATCGSGVQNRDVVCMELKGGEHVVSGNEHCSSQRPLGQKICKGSPCSAEWFTSDWSKCSKTCGSGIQQRTVRCLRDGVPTSGCSELSEPTGRRLCNTESCKIKHFPRPSLVTKPEENGDCVDQYHSCDLVVRANLCRINYYKRSCCNCRGL